MQSCVEGWRRARASRASRSDSDEPGAMARSTELGSPGAPSLDRAPVHLHDLLSDEGEEFPIGQDMSRRDGVRTILSVPLLRENDAHRHHRASSHAK